MSGIYLHIPFCKKACVYCDFHFSTNLSRKSEMIEAIRKEITIQKDFLPNKSLSSIYFGGGTPSVLSATEINEIIAEIDRHFTISPDAEITLEANPDDLDASYLQELRSTSINRLSIGIQSFRDSDLELMNRSHNASQALNCIRNAQDLGFQNLSLDLIYGIPGMSEKEWEEQIEIALELNVPHISSYALTVEPKTVLAHQVKTGVVKEAADGLVARQFEILWKRLAEAGFDHYEVSNFAKPEFRAVHNSSYWQAKPYLGVGPSAHSFKSKLRQWNVKNNALYIKSINDGEMAFEKEVLSEKDAFNERIMIGLRTVEGLDLKQLKSDFAHSYLTFIQNEMRDLLEEGKLVENGSFLKIPQEWRFHSDGIASSLFYI